MLIAPVLALMAAVLLTSPVHAEGNCPPGYYPIGGGNSGFQGCAPMSGHSGSDDGSPGGGRVARPSNSPHDSYYAVVSHPNSSDVWIMSNAPSKEQIERAALQICRAYMGEGCTVDFSSLDSVASIARGMDGDLYYASTGSAKESDAAVLAYCRKLNDYCAVFRRWTASRNHGLQSFNPARSSPRSFQSAVWARDPASGQHSDPTFYVSGGHPTKEAAEKAALAACQQASGRPCDIARTVKDTFIVLARRSDGAVRISSSPTEAMAPVIAHDVCEKQGATCTITSIIPATKGGVTRYSPLG